jgi:hypothetical protein
MYIVMTNVAAELIARRSKFGSCVLGGGRTPCHDPFSLALVSFLDRLKSPAYHHIAHLIRLLKSTVLSRSFDPL